MKQINDGAVAATLTRLLTELGSPGCVFSSESLAPAVTRRC